ncbi:flagellar protein FlaG [Clostridium sp. Mt-5]|uniref:Flagellar protein FlaG n=1 Tax=Clostridium moutaii TaxID=3240932 RepID=A0ABV4BL79_9CLOT
MEVTGMGQGGQMPLDLSTSSGITEISGDKAVINNNSGTGLSQSSVAKDKEQKNTVVNNAKDAVNQANKIMDEAQTHLKFEIYGKFKDIVVQVVDDNTNKVLLEVPPKKLIDMIQKFCELSGFFMDEKV